MILLSGRKKWRVYPRSETPLLYPNVFRRVQPAILIAYPSPLRLPEPPQTVLGPSSTSLSNAAAVALHLAVTCLYSSPAPCSDMPIQ